jgi:L-ascorbate metabolism protein UlaG (beta-lactamase superfamily)
MGGAVTVRYIGHATVLLELDGVRILSDPFLRDRLGPLERHGPRPDPAAIGPIDVVLISHGHPDHFDRRSIAALEGRPTVVAPSGLGPTLRRWFGGDVVELRAGRAAHVSGVPIEAVRAKHWISPGAPRAQPLGYVVGKTSRVWFAGDTGRFAGMRELRGAVDLALLPVWTWGPHWGTLYPRSLHRLWTRPLVEPGDRFAAAAARVAPETDVYVLRPGEEAEVSG